MSLTAGMAPPLSANRIRAELLYANLRNVLSGFELTAYHADQCVTVIEHFLYDERLPIPLP